MAQYIDKGALIVEINRLIAELIEEGEDTMFEQGRISAFEDENRINRLIAYFEDKESFTAEDDVVYANWLKSLKERVQPQPKQEWSEEDKTIITNIIIMLKEGASLHFNKKDMLKGVNWLNSLRERYTLKPSNEHYELEEFAKIVRSNLTGISKDVQELFESKYLQLTGNKMYGGFKD